MLAIFKQFTIMQASHMRFWGLLWIFLVAGGQIQAAGHYALAFWREAGAYENQAPPAGQVGNHSAYVHVWDEQGQPVAGKKIYTSWGVLLGTTDVNGFAEIELRRPNGYDFQIRDGSHSTDTTPILSVERAPTWGYYSFEIGFMFKANSATPGSFDTRHYGTINASGSDPCTHLSAPHTRSLAYYSTAASNYCSDPYQLGNWKTSHGQTFVATGNRVVAAKAFMAAGFGAHFYWTAQILEGGPDGIPIGPPRSTRIVVDGEWFPVKVAWGFHDVQVVPGRTYYLKISRDEGVNVYRVNRNNYAQGTYHENGVPVPDTEMMGLVVCGNYTNANKTGVLSGMVRGTNGVPISGVNVNVPDAGLYTTTAADGTYTIHSLVPGVYDVQAARTGFITGLNTNVVIQSGMVSTSDFVLTRQGGAMDSGIIATPVYHLQPFEVDPVWTSAFNASWGGPANYDIVSLGHTGNALQVSRGGAGSSARVQVFNILPGTQYQVSVWARCPSSSATYWSECAYRLGNRSAEDFDNSAGSWTLVKKFSNTGENGNGSTWTRYTASFNSGSNTQVSLGFKLGAASGTGPVVQWDQVSIVSLTLPSVSVAVADTATNITLRFQAPVHPAYATNPGNYALTSTNGAAEVLGAVLVDGTNVMLATTPLASRVDYLLQARNVIMVGQPEKLAGTNAQVLVTVPWTLLSLDQATLWKYHAQGSNLVLRWRMAGYDDSSWPVGAQPLGYTSGTLPVPIATTLAPLPYRYTAYFRHAFVPPTTNGVHTIRVRTLVDDGAIFWLNGGELLRVGMAGGVATYSTLANRNVGIAAVEGPFDSAGWAFAPGTNTLMVEVHQFDPFSPDMVFAAEVQLLVRPSSLAHYEAKIQVVREGEQIRISWPPGWNLFSAPGLNGPWDQDTASGSPLNISPTNPARFFRLIY